MATGLILVLIVGALGYLGIIYTSPALYFWRFAAE